MTAKELTATAPERTVALVERRVIRRMRRIIERGTVNASRIDDDGNEIPISQREKHIAMDMRKAKRFAPVYLEIAQRRVEAHEKAEALRNQGAPVSLNIGTVNIVQAREYPVIDVEVSAE